MGLEATLEPRRERGASPTVSVVVPIFNAELFLEEAILSVIGQTRSDWELLLVDDGSTDGSAAIARRYEAADPRIHYLDHPGHRNLGQHASRNLGLRHAQAEYVALLDADDVWLPEKLERQVAILDSHPEAELLFGAPLYWFGWTGRAEDSRRDYVIDLRLPADRVYDAPSLLLAFLGRKAPPPCPCDVMLRRETALRVGGFEEHFHGVHLVYEDTAFFSKVFLRARTFVSSQTWDRYRQRPDSCYAVAKATGGRELARRYYLEWFQQYLREQGETAGLVWQSVATELRPYRMRARLLRRARWEARRAQELGRRAARVLLPAKLRRWLRARVLGAAAQSPAPGAIRFGSLRRLTPVSRRFGWDRGGLPIDRWYIERFLEEHANDIAGHVLEVRDDTYTRKFGGGRVTRADVLHVTDDPRATIVADLTCADQIPSESFDCIVLTQVLPFIADVGAAVRTLHRILRPGGVVLATLPGISQIIRYDMDRWGDYWRFTSLSARRLFECWFPHGDIQVAAHGNVLAATAFLYGLSSRELQQPELEHHDRDYEVLITVRAVRKGQGAATVAADG
jgi:glycosyltransferase involved in cell wall biosynthesis